MELLQLLYFCHAAETESFAKTAREYNVPAASISQTVKRLEYEIGASLFDRSANGVKLNERGRILYRNAKSALSMLDDAKRKIRDEEISGTIRILVETNRHIVNHAIKAFCEKYKNIAFIIDHQVNADREKYTSKATRLFIEQLTAVQKIFQAHNTSTESATRFSFLPTITSTLW
ncbi:MAG: LysR family transcriptional regulator [Ruminococcaceae bacterium]|nr:LysR family transcriptional regulator [Oscillospiraceae bacterium]